MRQCWEGWRLTRSQRYLSQCRPLVRSSFDFRKRALPWPQQIPPLHRCSIFHRASTSRNFQSRESKGSFAALGCCGRRKMRPFTHPPTPRSDHFPQIRALILYRLPFLLHRGTAGLGFELGETRPTSSAQASCARCAPSLDPGECHAPSVLLRCAKWTTRLKAT